MCHSNPSDNSVGGSVMNSFAVVLSAAQQDTVVANSSRMVMAMRTSPPVFGFLRAKSTISCRQRYAWRTDEEWKWGVLNVKCQTSQVKCQKYLNNSQDNPSRAVGSLI